MKPTVHSRLFWAAITGAFLSSLSAGLAATDGVPAWIIVVVSSASAAASVAVAALRAADGGKP